MKKQTAFLLLILLFNLKVVYSQNVKTKYQSFKYEVLPTRPLASTYKTYKVDATSDATDGVALNGKFIYLGEEYITGLQNSTITYVKSGVMIGGAVIGKEPEKAKEIPASLQISIVFKNIEMMDKKEFVNKPTNPATNVIENYLTYKLSFRFSYAIKVKDVATNQYLLDTIIDTPKSTLFPCDYRFDAHGNKIYAPGYLNKPDLDADYNRNGKDIYVNSKMILAQQCMNETKLILKSLYGYDWQSQIIAVSRVKSKSPTFNICDTVSDLMDHILDSVSYHTKKEKHLNWHTTNIKVQAQKVAAIWEDMLINEKYLNEFKDPKDKQEFINKTKRNLIVAYLFQDNFDKAVTLYYEVEPSTIIKSFGQNLPDDNMRTLWALIQREKKLFNTHKQTFNFN